MQPIHSYNSNTFIAIDNNRMCTLQVQLNFLPVGHTHEDIDQMFSRISESIRQNGCETIPGI